MKIIKKLKDNLAFSDIKKQLNSKNCNSYTVESAIYMARENKQYEKELVPMLLKIIDSNKQEYYTCISLMAKLLPDSRQMVDDYIIGAIKDPYLSLSFLENEYSTNYDAHIDIIKSKGNIYNLLSLAYVIQQRNLGTNRFEIVMQELYKNVTKNSSVWSKEDKYTFAEKFYNKLINGKDTKEYFHYKQEIINDVLYNIASAKLLLRIYGANANMVDLNKVIGLDKKGEFLGVIAEVSPDAVDTLDDATLKAIIKKAIKQKDSKSIHYILNNLTPSRRGLVDVIDLEDALIDSRDTSGLFTLLNNYNGADKQKISDYIMQYGSFEDHYKFAKLLPEVDIDKHLTAMVQLQDKNTYTPKTFSDAEVRQWKDHNDRFIDKLYGPSAYHLTEEESRREMERKEQEKFQAYMDESNDMREKILEIGQLKMDMERKRLAKLRYDMLEKERENNN